MSLSPSLYQSIYLCLSLTIYIYFSLSLSYFEPIVLAPLNGILRRVILFKLSAITSHLN